MDEVAKFGLKKYMHMTEKCFLVQKIDKCRNGILHQILSDHHPGSFSGRKKKSSCNIWTRRRNTLHDFLCAVWIDYQSLNLNISTKSIATVTRPIWPGWHKSGPGAQLPPPWHCWMIFDHQPRQMWLIFLHDAVHSEIHTAPGVDCIGFILVLFCWHSCLQMHTAIKKIQKNPLRHQCRAQVVIVLGFVETSSAQWPISRWCVLDQQCSPTSTGLTKLVSPWGIHRVTVAML